MGIVGIVGKCLSERFDDPDVIHDESVALSGAHTVGAGDGLHKTMRLHWLIEVHCRKGLHVEAGEPHRADENDSQRVLGVFELVVEAALLHLLAVGLYVEAPLIEVCDLVLLLADDDRHLGRLHPVNLASLLQRLLLAHGLELALLFPDCLFPVFLYVVEHHHGRDLVHAYEHCLSGLPNPRVMRDEVFGDFAETRLRHDYMHAVREFSLNLLRLLVVEVGRFHGVE